jgi:hypothetical protein
MESRRDPVKPLSFHKPVGKMDFVDIFDPRHEESMPMVEDNRAGEYNDKPSFMDDEIAPSKVKGGKEESNDEKSSSEGEKVLSKKEGLLRNVLKSRTEKSDALTKMKNEENEQLFQKSIHSSSSMKTSFGSAFIKDIMNNFKYPKLLTRMKIIGVIEIIFFLAINVVYVLLIRSRLDDFETNINKMTYSGALTESYTRVLVDQNLKYLVSQKIIQNLDDLDVKIINTLDDGAYEEFRDFFYFRQEINFLSQFHFNEQKVTRFQDGVKEVIKVDQYNLYDLLLNTFESVREEKKVGKLETTDLDEYLFLRANFIDTILANEFLIVLYLDIGDGDKYSLENFYLIISIVGLSIAVILQLLNLPFLSKFFQHIQKLVLLITRITSDECLTEISKFYLI